MISQYKYIGTEREKENKLAAKKDILEIIKIAARYNMKKDDPKTWDDLQEIKALYDKI